MKPEGTIAVEEVLDYLQQDRYLSIREAVKYLGLSERTLRARLREIPHFRVGGKILIRKLELDDWMERFRIRPDEKLSVLVRRVFEG